ncbi:hypothetical protein DB44_CU00010 [Candidatus Protochlamydia amoebophila]|uniref:Uncharacterized protein n=1 Tax=Candidatus Protochlamydia amoebophila TaxID=362787 RepID=A0A0C1H2X9_9BACT|nr:hypothetical protein DB44_CU00010 [Candidatus Protochlamydia amoebophila]
MGSGQNFEYRGLLSIRNIKRIIKKRVFEDHDLALKKKQREN